MSRRATNNLEIKEFSMDPCAIEFLPRTYNKTGAKGAEPEKRWLNLIVRSSGSKWHVKVTFRGTTQDTQNPNFSNRPKRRKDLENLCACIDFQQISLLDDTVTELILTRWRLPCKEQPNADSDFTSVAGGIWVHTWEDPLRVRYPLYRFGSSIPTKDISEIKEKEALDDGIGAVHNVRLYGDETVYIYKKEVGPPFYVPPDSEVLERELQNLVLLRDNSVGIVRLIAAVVSSNPYQTSELGEAGDPIVLRGFLLEYHPNGTLEDALRTPKLEMNGRWCRWASQITTGLAQLHQCDLAHMDLKPSNVVISADFDAVLIDVSGIGGVTREWLSPEMRDENEPLSRSIEARQQNDIWALGQMLSAMADACCSDDEERLLRSMARYATRPPPRMSLSHIITALSECLSEPSPNSSQAGKSGSNHLCALRLDE
ncbi:kinase-like domain-containing protein [Achaetomium macrosporum]|uniref:Kinase-like domain-containing protein n=1 Tax=Achaetomium macrosporum TaxID=79813 RepID=A0AAN7CIM8_9PEZI|nr:kinase-like domain-containing protein [Achaetomium macrosporum]